VGFGQDAVDEVAAAFGPLADLTAELEELTGLHVDVVSQRGLRGGAYSIAAEARPLLLSRPGTRRTASSVRLNERNFLTGVRIFQAETDFHPHPDVCNGAARATPLRMAASTWSGELLGNLRSRGRCDCTAFLYMAATLTVN
jgi:hypothetical protein